MKYSEALNELVKALANEKIFIKLETKAVLQQAIDKANKYDEKETPAIVKNAGSYNFLKGNCPKCNFEVINEYAPMKYCPHCGQRLEFKNE